MNAMAIIVKSSGEIELMRQAGRIAAGARSIARQMVEPGVSTKAINKEVFHFIKKSGAEPTFLGYCGYPASVCISVNDQVIHGIPGSRRLQEGDIVSIDVGATWKGFVGDCAGTYPCGQCSDEALRLIAVTRQSFFEGIRYARHGHRVSRPTRKRTAAQSCATMWVTASARRCTRTRRFPTMYSKGTAIHASSAA